jgi:hypothetical protein
VCTAYELGVNSPSSLNPHHLHPRRSMATQQVVSHNMINNVDRDQYLTVHNHYVPVENDSSSSRVPTSLSFNDAPIDLLSIHFTGRGRELADIGRILDVVHDDAPAHCVIHGMRLLDQISEI